MRSPPQLDDLRALVSSQFGAGRHLTALDRVTGGTKKGVFRLHLDDGTTAILYVWAPGENFWPPAQNVPDDPFTDATGADLLATSHAALTAAGVRVPHLLMLDRNTRHLDPRHLDPRHLGTRHLGVDHLGARHLGADVALVEDVGTVRLDSLLRDDPTAAVAPLAALGDALRRMHTTTAPAYGRPSDLARRAVTTGQRPAEDVIVDRALGHLSAAARVEPRIAAEHDRIAGHVRRLRDAVAPRQVYGLVHGELGPDHVHVTPAGEPVLIDIEGLTWFDVEWDHAFLQLRFGDAYPALRPVDLDPHRLSLYSFAQVLSLIEGPLRIAGTDFPDRQWMLELAERNIIKALDLLAAPQP